MLHNLHTLLDTIFPPTATHLTLRRQTAQTFLQHYAAQSIGRHSTALSNYHNQTIQAAITECKYRHNQHATNLLAVLLRHWLTTQPTLPTLLIPIPLSPQRQRRRGYNQVEVVCRQVTDLPYVRIASSLLYRVRDTAPQTTLPRATRFSNMEKAFAIDTSQLPRLQTVSRIIVCDDVCTTGATLAAAHQALQSHIPTDATLNCLSWAH